MTEPMFFKQSIGLSVSEIAALANAEPRTGAHLERRISNIAPLEVAGPDDLTYIDNAKHVGDLESTQAGACLLTAQFEAHAPPHVAVLRAREPYRAFVMVAKALFPDALRPHSLFEASDAATGAAVHASARIESGVTIDPGVVIGPRAEIGAGSVIAAGALIGPEVRIGRECAVGAGATVMHALIGDRVLIHPGCRIGQDGYGYLAGPKWHEKIPKLGRVIIQDDVEIGANTTIDRGSFRDTMIGEGTKIDNLVQIGHNVVVGRHCALVAQVGISGSVTIGDYVVLEAKVGVIEHVDIGERAVITTGSSVMTNVPAGARWGGYPAGPGRDFLRRVAKTKRLVGRVRGSENIHTNQGEGEEE
jgi:UDP-3-O-[3-hydroxymyristoyl] glucosamine N-acyltransferase